MATVNRPTLLAFSEGLSDAGNADFEPEAAKSWEVHSVVVSGACDVKRQYDTNEDDTFGTAITVHQFTAAGELMGLKLEVEDGVSRIRITNTSGGDIDVFVMGVIIE